jgi:hypothetical protein
MNDGAEPLKRTASVYRMVAAGALVVAATFGSIRLWSHLCQFPAMVWNDIRVAPAVALARGGSVYSTATEGVINTWTYGPLPLVFLTPAALADSPAGALLIAGALNLLLIVLPLAAVGLVWPSLYPGRNDAMARATAVLLCVSVWPRYFYETYYCDSLAIACGLLGNLVLIRGQSERARWIGAVLSAAAVACKPIAIGIPLAQILWLGGTAGRRAALTHGARCAVAGAGIAAACILKFGAAGLWYMVIRLPGMFAWAPDPWERLSSSAPELGLHVALPLAVMAIGRRAFRTPLLALPALAWACTLPFGLAALLKFGGRMNSIYSLELWLAPVLTVGLTAAAAKARPLLPLAGAVAAALLACGRVLRADSLPMRPQIAAYGEAVSLARQYPGQIWFPFHPLVTLFTEGRYYHDEDGLYVRIRTRQTIPDTQAAAHLPPALHIVALRNGWSDWNIARRMLPPKSRGEVLGNWVVWGAPALPSPGRAVQTVPPPP